MEEGGEEIDGLRQGLDNVVLDFNPTRKKKKVHGTTLLPGRRRNARGVETGCQTVKEF